MAIAINQNNITDIIKFYNDSMKAVEKQKVDIKANKKSLHVFSNMSSQIIQFYKTTNSIVEVAMSAGVQLTKEIAESQKIIFESIGSVLGVINTLNNTKFPSAHKSIRQAKKLRREVYALTDIFLGPGSIAAELSSFDYLKHGGVTETYDEKGNVVKRTKIDSLSPSDAVKGFVDLVDAVIKIINNTTTLSKNVTKAYVLTNMTWPMLIGKTKKHPGILTRYLNLLNTKTFQTLKDPETKKQISEVVGNVRKFSEIVETINEATSIKSVLSLIIYDNFILTKLEEILPHIVRIYNNSKELKETSSFDRIKDIIDYLNEIVDSIKELSNNRIRSKKVNKIIFKVNEIIVEISKFASDVKKRKFSGIQPQIKTIKNIIDSMISLVKDIILLAVTSIPLTIAIPGAMLALSEISLFIRFAIRKFNKMTNTKDYTQLVLAMSNITKMVGMILLMVTMVLGTMIIISLSLPLIIENYWKTVGVFTVISALVLLVAGLAWLINKIFSKGIEKQVFKGLLLMTAIMGEMLLTTGMLLILAQVADDFFKDKKWLKTLAMFGIVGAVTLATAGLGYLISTLAVGIALFSASTVLITVAIGAIILIGYELKVLAGFEFSQEEKERVKATVATIIGTAKAVMDGLFNGFDDQDNPKSDNSSAFSKFFKSIFKGAAFVIEALTASAVMIFTTISVTMMLIVGAELKMLANYELDKKSVINNANTIMSTADAVIDAIFEPAEERNTEGGGKFITGLKHFFIGLADILQLIAAVGKLALSMIAIAFVRLLGSELKWVANFDTSTVTGAATNTHIIMGTADSVISSIFEPAEERNTEGGSRFTSVIKHFFSGLLDIVELIVAVGKIALSLAAIALVKLLGNQLKTIAEFDVSSVTSATDNVQTIMGVAQAVIDAIFAPGEEPKSDESKKQKFFGFIKNALSDVATVVESVVGIGKVAIMLSAIGMVSFLAKTIKTINDISKDVDKQTVLDNTDMIMEVTNDIIKKVFDSKSDVDINMKKLNAFEDMTKVMKKFFKVFDNKKADNIEKNVNSAVRFIDRVDSVKIEKLETANNIFAKMAEFSKTINDNFNELADTINERFMPALDQISETLDKTNDMAEKGKFGINVTTNNGTSKSNTQPTAVTPAQLKDYTSVINDVKQEIKRIQDILTDGSQKVSIDNH